MNADERFDPQKLVKKCLAVDSQEGCQLASTIEAVYVSTRGRPRYVEALLDEVCGIGPRVFLIPTDRTEDLPATLTSVLREVDVLAISDSAVPKTLEAYETFRHPVFSVSQEEWDLPVKRNAALLHAVQNGFRCILLLDDDIRGVTPAFLRRASASLDSNAIVGAFVTEFPDTSVVGHIERAVGVDVLPFMSGSCLFVDVAAATGMFPSIYNEDWLFMAPEIAQGRACSLGTVCQVPTEPFKDPLKPWFQEPGELIADSIFAMLSVNAYDDRFKVGVWSTFLEARRAWLRELKRRVENEAHRTALDQAEARLEHIGPHDCVDYVFAIERDKEAWKRFVAGA